MSTLLAESPVQSQQVFCDELYQDAMAGLMSTPKQLPSKYFYDERGSALFEQICNQPEYYLTRAELALMEQHAVAIAEFLGPRVLLTEYGCGSGLKTRLLLNALQQPVAYVPVEISPVALHRSTEALKAELPLVPVTPLIQDFTDPVWPGIPPTRPDRRVIYFPGSTIGNFAEDDSVALMTKMRREMGRHGVALIGIDLKKDVATLEAAYNDAAGVTAAFTLNLLTRMNRELDADFALDRFEHQAGWNEEQSRIDTHIVSVADQRVRVADQAFEFAKGEAMLVEHSCKYSHEHFAELAGRAGLHVAERWLDHDRRFSVQALVTT